MNCLEFGVGKCLQFALWDAIYPIEYSGGWEDEVEKEGREINRMTRDAPLVRDPVDRSASDTQHRCLYCDRVIPALADEDLAVGFDSRLGLVSDECALVCNECTAKLIETRSREPVVTGRRK
jgi:hypothetical protein